jgi:hypothetical protein
MKNVLALLFAITLLAATLEAGTGVATTESEKGNFELTVSTSIDANRPEVAFVDAVLKDTRTGQVVTAPRITLKVGEKAEISSEGEDFTFTMAVATDPAANLVTAEALYSIGGELVFAPRITFELR